MTTTRRLNDSNKVIVTAALTGAVTTKQDNPYLPTQPKEIAEAALRCVRRQGRHGTYTCQGRQRRGEHAL